VRIFGLLNLPGQVPVNASSLYAKNLLAFLEPFIDKENKTLAIDWDDELAKGTGIARDGAIVNEMIAERLGGKDAAKADPKPARAPRAPTKTGTAKQAGNGRKAPAKKSGAKRQPKGDTTP